MAGMADWLTARAAGFVGRPREGAPRPQRSERQRSLRFSILLVPGVGAGLLLFVLPLVRLVVYSFQGDRGAITAAAYGDLFDGYTVFLKSLVRTAEIAAVVSFATLVLGYPLAYVATRLRPKLGALLLGCVTLPFFTSALVRTYAWQVLLANNGLVNRALLDLQLISHPLTLVYSNVGVVIGMTQVLLPMMVFPLYSSMRRIDRSLLLAAQSMGANPVSAWIKIYFPMTVTGMSAGLSIVFVTAIGFYVTPVLLAGPSTPLIAQRINSLIGLPGERSDVSAESTVLLVITLLIIFVFRRQLGLTLESPDEDRATRARLRRRRASDTGTTRPRFAGLSDRLQDSRLMRPLESTYDVITAVLSRVRYGLLGVLVLLGLVVSLLPLVVIVMVAFSNAPLLSFPPPGYSTRWFSTYLHDSQWLSSTWLSLWVSALAALVATILGGLAAYYIVRAQTRRVSTASYLLLVSPMVMPQIVLAVGLYFTIASTPLLGSVWALFLAYIILGLPLTTIMLAATFRNLDASFERAAASLGAGALRIIRTILIPLIAPALFGAALFAFVTAFDDLVMAQFLGGVNSETLVRRMYDNIKFEVSPEVAAVGSIFIGGVLVVIALAAVVRSRIQRRLVGRKTSHQTIVAHSPSMPSGADRQPAQH